MRLATVSLVLLLAASAAFGQFTVTSTTPTASATSVPLSTTITITFSAAADTGRGFRSGDEYFSNITPLTTSWSADRRTVSVQVSLAPSTPYFMLVHSVQAATGGGLPVPYLFRWTTDAAFPTTLHSVNGVITSGGSPVSTDNALVGLMATPFSGGGPPAFVGVAVSDGVGAFSIPFIPDGTWYPIAAKDADGDGQIDPSRGDPIAFGDSVVVNGANVFGVALSWMTLEPLHFAKARDSITSRAAAILPANRELRQFYAWGIDSTGAAREFAAIYSVPGSQVLTEIWMEALGLNSDTSSFNNQWAMYSRPYTGLASAIILDSIVARAERMGGKEFRRQAPPVAGSNFEAYARVGALNNTEFNYWISDTSRYYWGLQYMFQIQVNQDSSYSVAWKTFIADAVTGEILLVTGADQGHEAPLPASFDLGQNYPNPFNPSTTISFSVPTQSRVKITVFNLLGQEMATLVNDVRNPGTHQAVWNASVPSGIYFYRMEAVGTDAPAIRYTQVRKMMLVR